MKYETKSLVVREPIGVVAVLCAFNFPLPGIAQKTAPALVAGCTAVVKVPRGRPAGDLCDGRPGLRGRFPAGRPEHRRGRPRVLRVPGSPPRRRHGLLHRLDRGRQEDRRRCARAGQALRARARRQVGRDHPRRRRPRGGAADGGRHQRRHEPGRELRLHEPHPRPALALRRDCPHADRGIRLAEGRRPARGRHGRRPADLDEHRERVLGYVQKGVEEGAHPRLRRQGAGASRQGLLRRADAADQRQQRHDRRPGGDLRPGHRPDPVRRRRGRDPHRQRQPLRPRRMRLHGRSVARAGRSPAASRPARSP